MAVDGGRRTPYGAGAQRHWSLPRALDCERGHVPPALNLLVSAQLFFLSCSARHSINCVHCPLSTVHGGARLQPKLIGRLDPSLAISSLFPQKAHNSVKTQAQDISTSAEGALQIPRCPFHFRICILAPLDGRSSHPTRLNPLLLLPTSP